MGKFDITAMIDKVLEVSGEEKIFYIGHSMGTTGTKIKKTGIKSHTTLTFFYLSRFHGACKS